MQIKTALRFHLTLVSINRNKGWRGWREKGMLAHCWWECSHSGSSLAVPTFLKCG